MAYSVVVCSTVSVVWSVVLVGGSVGDDVVGDVVVGDGVVVDDVVVDDDDVVVVARAVVDGDVGGFDDFAVD